MDLFVFRSAEPVQDTVRQGLGGKGWVGQAGWEFKSVSGWVDLCFQNWLPVRETLKLI